MAKKPETREVYRIHGETSKEEFGEYLAVLTKMGMQNIGYELVTEVATFKQRRQSGNGGETASLNNEQVARAWIEKNPSFAAKDLVAHFDAVGRHPASAYQAMRNLMEARFLSRSAPGKYHLATMKALPPPASVPMVKKAKAAKKAAKAKAGKPPKYPRGHAPRLEIGNAIFLWNQIKNRKSFNLSLLKDRFLADGRNPKSISPIITKLAQAGSLKNSGGGDYEVTGKPPGKVAGKSNSGEQPNQAQQGGVDGGE